LSSGPLKGIVRNKPQTIPQPEPHVILLLNKEGAPSKEYPPPFAENFDDFQRAGYLVMVLHRMNRVGRICKKIREWERVSTCLKG
jgi:hypothetical protein